MEIKQKKEDILIDIVFCICHSHYNSEKRDRSGLEFHMTELKNCVDLMD